ncbi:hypothetical protein [uncultured Chitinophaga sp.]|uniref:hypothetical protein n=1 Tax=uncultured Chitinophaga sp. TaxID=339340 RepID=UPI0025DB9E8B|nr:hypothetical protein [uncultured Chitinophaga sp.]
MRRKAKEITQHIKQHLENEWESLSYYEDSNNTSFLEEAGRHAATNAVNENLALGLPITYFEDGWVVRRLADKSIVRIKKVEEPEDIKHDLTFKKGITVNVKR